VFQYFFALGLEMPVEQGASQQIAILGSIAQQKAHTVHILVTTRLEHYGCHRKIEKARFPDDPIVRYDLACYECELGCCGCLHQQ
jgi:hypothetical protein